MSQLRSLPNILGIFDESKPVAKTPTPGDFSTHVMLYSSDRFRLPPDPAWQRDVASYSCGWIGHRSPWLLVTYQGKSDLLSGRDDALHDMLVAPSDLLPVIDEFGPSIVSGTLLQPQLTPIPTWAFLPVTEFWVDATCPPTVIVAVTAQCQHLFAATDQPYADCTLRRVFPTVAGSSR